MRGKQGGDHVGQGGGDEREDGGNHVHEGALALDRHVHGKGEGGQVLHVDAGRQRGRKLQQKEKGGAGAGGGSDSDELSEVGESTDSLAALPLHEQHGGPSSPIPCTYTQARSALTEEMGMGKGPI